MGATNRVPQAPRVVAALVLGTAFMPAACTTLGTRCTVAFEVIDWLGRRASVVNTVFLKVWAFTKIRCFFHRALAVRSFPFEKQS